MNAAEAAVLLSAISANDNREVTESASRAWAAALPDVALQDALDFLPNYYRAAVRDGKNWIYPGDVLDGVLQLHKERRIIAADRAEAALGIPSDVPDMERDLLARSARVEAVKAYNAAHTIPSRERSAEQASARVQSMLGIAESA